MRARSKVGLAGAIALLAGATAAPASAVTGQVDLGAGQTPTVFVDGAGTAYIAWAAVNGTGPAYFCKLPRGATACAGGGPVTFTPPMSFDDTFAPPYVFQRPDGSLVFTIDRSFNQVIWTSTDGGATWSPPTNAEGNPIGDQNPSGDAILSPDGSAQEVITDVTTGGVKFQFQPFAGPKQTSNALFSSYEYGGSLATVSSSLTMAAFWQIPNGGGNDSTAFSLYHGAPGTAMNDISAWSAPTVIDSPAQDTRLAQGPAGVGLLENLGNPPSNLVYRRFDSASGTFGAPSSLIKNGTQEEDAFQDGSGRVHAAWVQPSGLYYDRSDDGGSTWRTPVVIASGSFANSHPKVGAAPDGKGWLVYASAGGTGQAVVHAVPLDYAALAGGTGGGTSGGGGGGSTGSTTTTTVTVGTDVVTLQTPRGCVRAGLVTAKLSVRSRKRKGHVVVKISKVTFKVDGRTVKIVRRAPFRITVRLTLAPGSKHTLSALAQIKIHHGKPRSKTLKNTFTAC